MFKRSTPLFAATFLFACLLLSGCAAPVTAVPTALPTAVPTLAPTPTATASPAGTVLWTFAAGNSIWSSPVVSNGLIYFGSDDQSLYAVDLQTHQLAWKFATGGVIRSRPAVLGNMVYASSDDGVLHALDAAEGVEKWQANIGSGNARTGGPFDVGSGYDYNQSSPTVAEGVVYVGSGGGELHALEAASGKALWSFKTGVRIRSTPMVTDGKVYVGDGNGTLHALDAKTGAELWNQPGCDVPSPAVSGGLVYCGSRGTYEVRAWDAISGDLRWQFSVGRSWVDSSPVIAGGTLYNGSSDAATLYALDAATGVEKWKFATKGYAWCTPAVSGDKVYMGSYNMGIEGTLFAIQAASGQPAWSLTVKGGVFGSPLVHQGVVYFTALDGSLYAVQE